jgi:hypothetical protein
MAIQSNAEVTLAYKAESTFGVSPTNTGAQLLRRVSSNLNLAKDSFASNEVRSDMQISDMRHGGRSASGTIEGELSTLTYDEFFEAAMGGTWAAGVSAAPADFATGVTIATSGATSTLTFAGTGSLITKGFKVGDIVRATGLTNAANNNRNLRIVALTATVMTVFPAIAAATQQASGWAVAVAGRKLLMGNTKRSFTLEQSFPDATTYELFNGMRVGGFTVGVQPNGMSTVSWDFLGQNQLAPANAAYFSSPTAETTTGILSGIDGALRLNGAELGIITGLQMQMTNNLSVQPVIGSKIAPDVFRGRKVLTGSVSAFLDDRTMLQAFEAETEIDIVAVLQASGNAPQDFMSFSMQRVKFSAATKSVGPDGGVVVQFPFQALLKPGGSTTTFDQSTLVIQRSNA